MFSIWLYAYNLFYTVYNDNFYSKDIKRYSRLPLFYIIPITFILNFYITLTI